MDLTKNQIDHMAVSRERRKSLIDVRTYRSADIASDHELVIGRVKLKLRAFKRAVSNIPRYDTSKLLNIEKQEEYAIECRNRFEVLELLQNDDVTIDEMWTDVREVYQETGNVVLGLRKGKRKKWLKDDTWNTLEKRKKQKNVVDSFHGSSEALLIEKVKYRSLDSEVKRKARKDRRDYFEDLADEAEVAINSGSGFVTRKAHKILNEITTGTKPSNGRPIKDKHGNILTTDEEKKRRWMEHFDEVMNRPFDPMYELEISEFHP